VSPDVCWTVQHFLAELQKVDLRDTNPSRHELDRRLRLAEMVLTEVGNTDLECLAVRALAERTRDLCIAPASLDAIGAWVATRRAYLEAVEAGPLIRMVHRLYPTACPAWITPHHFVPQLCQSRPTARLRLTPMRQRRTGCAWVTLRA
jgi:hypothetical protein